MKPGLKRALELIEECKIKQSLFLDLGNLDLEEWPEALWALTHLEGLNLGFSYYDQEKEERVSSINLFLMNRLKEIPKEISCLNQKCRM